MRVRAQDDARPEYSRSISGSIKLPVATLTGSFAKPLEGVLPVTIGAGIVRSARLLRIPLRSKLFCNAASERVINSPAAPAFSNSFAIVSAHR